MHTRQKVILLLLVLLSVIQQGVRWKMNGSEAGRGWETTVLATTVQAAAPAVVDQKNRHCSLVHVNSAGMAELQTLPGIGPAYAERIMIERREHPFVEKHDLLRVSGIGEKRLAQIAPLICLYYDEHGETR